MRPSACRPPTPLFFLCFPLFRGFEITAQGPEVFDERAAVDDLLRVVPFAVIPQGSVFHPGSAIVERPDRLLRVGRERRAGATGFLLDRVAKRGERIGRFSTCLKSPAFEQDEILLHGLFNRLLTLETVI